MRAALRSGTIGALLFCAVSLPASAAMSVYYHVGSWDAFSGPGADGKPVCGIGSTNPADGQSFSMRFQIGGETVVFQAKKPTWNIPDGTQVSVVLQIGLNTPWTLQAVGNGQIVEWSLDRDAMQAFDAQFRRGSSMTLTFPAGSEPPWMVALNGSTAISNTFGRCVTDLTRRAAAQPGATGQEPTQPSGQPPPTQGPTQPFAPGGAPAAPR